MPNSPNKKNYNANYAKTNLKRIPLDVQKEKYDQIKAAADTAGEKVNSYIKKAIDERMERDTLQKNISHIEHNQRDADPDYPRHETLDEKLERLRKKHT